MPRPAVDPAALVHPLACVCGDVTLGARASVRPYAALRAGPGLPCTLGAGVRVGHRAVVHGAAVGDGALVGIGAVLLNGARVGAGVLAAAGAVVREGLAAAPGVLVAGVPARGVRPLTEDERARLARTAGASVRL